jgi:hypothetical protein
MMIAVYTTTMAINSAEGTHVHSDPSFEFLYRLQRAVL